MINMHPMGFGEFLVANNKALLAEKIKNPGSQFSSATIQMINSEMAHYFSLGGCLNVSVPT